MPNYKFKIKYETASQRVSADGTITAADIDTATLDVKNATAAQFDVLPEQVVVTDIWEKK